MSKKNNRKAIAELTSRVQTLEASVTKLVIAVESLNTVSRPKPKASAKAKSAIASKQPITKKATVALLPRKQAAPAKKAAPVKTATNAPAKKVTSKTTPNLVETLKYALKHYQDNKSDPVKATQLYDDVYKAGYKFGSTDRKNNLNYLYKVLRINKAFKKSGDGTYTLA